MVDLKSVVSSCSNVLYSSDQFAVINSDSLSEIRKLPNHFVSLILTDPPYHSTKKDNIVGDTSFASDADFVNWMKLYSVEWKRILKYSGSAFCFCSSAMVSKLENMFSDEFNILSQIVWTKPNEPGYDGWKQKTKKESLRQWYAQSERIVFMEPAYSTNLFRSYFGSQLREWRLSAGLSGKELTELTGEYGKVNHGGAVSNWEAGRNTPSEEQYEKIIQVLGDRLPNYDFPRYNDIIRPFYVNKDIQYTDVWDFESVKQYRGKHPAEKPVSLLKHAIECTTNPGDIVLDCFCGSGNVALAALETNRKAILLDIEEKWCKTTVDKIKKHSFQTRFAD